MKQVIVFPYHVNEDTPRRKLIVKYRVYVEGEFNKTGFYVFPLPVTIYDVLDRARTNNDPDVLSFQDSMLIKYDNDGVFS